MFHCWNANVWNPFHTWEHCPSERYTLNHVFAKCYSYSFSFCSFPVYDHETIVKMSVNRTPYYRNYRNLKAYFPIVTHHYH